MIYNILTIYILIKNHRKIYLVLNNLFHFLFINLIYFLLINFKLHSNYLLNKFN